MDTNILLLCINILMWVDIFFYISLCIFISKCHYQNFIFKILQRKLCLKSMRRGGKWGGVFLEIHFELV